MKTNLILACASAAVLVLAACIVPPSMLERASWGPPPEYWQGEGRYRQTASGEAPAVEDEAPELHGAAPHADVTEPEHLAATVPGERARGEPAAKPPLYAWDGGVVDGSPQGRVTTQDGTPRGLETPPAGRAHIIELYQQVLDERDALAEEVELLRASLEQTSLALEAKTKEAQDSALRIATLEAAHQALVNDNQSIAARLVQAQIRRLEAEKMLLEARIESERARAEEASRAAAAQTRSGPRPKAAPKADGDGGDHE